MTIEAAAGDAGADEAQGTKGVVEEQGAEEPTSSERSRVAHSAEPAAWGCLYCGVVLKGLSLLILIVVLFHLSEWGSDPGVETILKRTVSPDGLIEARVSYHDWGAMRMSIYMVKLVETENEDEWESIRWCRRNRGKFEVAWIDKRALRITICQTPEKYVPLSEMDLPSTAKIGGETVHLSWSEGTPYDTRAR